MVGAASAVRVDKMNRMVHSQVAITSPHATTDSGPDGADAVENSDLLRTSMINKFQMLYQMAPLMKCPP